MGHARLSPSNTKWVHCPFSIEAEKTYPVEDVDNEKSILGSHLHTLAYNYIMGITPLPKKKYTFNKDGLNITVLKSHIDFIKDYSDTLKSYVEDLKDRFRGCEVKLDLEKKLYIGLYNGGFSQWWGTCDALIKAFSSDGMLVSCSVIDLKTGMISVPSDYPQLYSYMLGAVFDTTDSIDNISPFCEFTTAVYQNGNFDTTTINLKKLLHIRSVLINRAKLTYESTTPYFGKHCKYCKHSPSNGGTCESGGYDRYVAEESKNEYLNINLAEGISLLNVDNLTDDQAFHLENFYLAIASFVDLKKLLTDKLLSDVEKNNRVFNNIEVSSKKTYVWNNLNAFLLDNKNEDCLTTQVKSFTDLKKQGLDFENYTTKKESKFFRRK